MNLTGLETLAGREMVAGREWDEYREHLEKRYQRWDCTDATYGEHQCAENYADAALAERDEVIRELVAMLRLCIVEDATPPCPTVWEDDFDDFTDRLADLRARAEEGA